jgi:hypothetical protein
MPATGCLLKRYITGCPFMSKSPIFNSFARYSYYSWFGMKMSPNEIALIKMFYAILIYYKN